MKKVFLVAVLVILVGAVFLTSCTTGEAKKIAKKDYRAWKAAKGETTVNDITSDLCTIDFESIKLAVMESTDEEIKAVYMTASEEDQLLFDTVCKAVTS